MGFVQKFLLLVTYFFEMRPHQGCIRVPQVVRVSDAQACRFADLFHQVLNFALRIRQRSFFRRIDEQQVDLAAAACSQPFLF